MRAFVVMITAAVMALMARLFAIPIRAQWNEPSRGDSDGALKQCRMGIPMRLIVWLVGGNMKQDGKLSDRAIRGGFCIKHIYYTYFHLSSPAIHLPNPFSFPWIDAYAVVFSVEPWLLRYPCCYSLRQWKEWKTQAWYHYCRLHDLPALLVRPLHAACCPTYFIIIF